jgi:hypothetical protein
MKRSILCLLVILTLCLCILFVSCTKEDPGKNDPDSADIGKKGEIQTDRVQPEVELNGPNEQLPGFTDRQ